jgi:phage repressor protein C with HTH and peptisase S24 domain
LQVDEEFGYSMRPLINPGDLVLISFTAKIDDGDIVAARWDETRGALKICTYISGDPNLVVLMSYNQNVPPMGFQKDKINMYKVVLIKRK